MPEYNPVTGENWDRREADHLFGVSVQTANRQRRLWNLEGTPGHWRWRYFDFRPYVGTVVVKDDGFHWRTTDYDTATVIHEGVTTSIYEAYQSVTQNQPVKWVPA